MRSHLFRWRNRKIECSRSGGGACGELGPQRKHEKGSSLARAARNFDAAFRDRLLSGKGAASLEARFRDSGNVGGHVAATSS